MDKLLILIFLLTAQKITFAHNEGGGVEAVARFAWQTVEKCVSEAEYDLTVNQKELEDKYGEDTDRLYVMGLKIYDVKYQFTFEKHGKIVVTDKVYSCAEEFPYFSYMHFHTMEKLRDYVMKVRGDEFSHF